MHATADDWSAGMHGMGVVGKAGSARAASGEGAYPAETVSAGADALGTLRWAPCDGHTALSARAAESGHGMAVAAHVAEGPRCAAFQAPV